ncbi:MAG: hypothetical protein IJ881_06125, partial [Neisseriaceae bacterium]|nr:hypothetical protein [Neisseriaceae bacterium]
MNYDKHIKHKLKIFYENIINIKGAYFMKILIILQINFFPTKPKKPKQPQKTKRPKKVKWQKIRKLIQL